MFDLVLNTPFICSANQLTGFYLIRISREFFFSKQTIEIWILILIIPIIHAKKIYTKFDKICIFEKKSTQKLPSWKEILSWMIWNFSIIHQKHALTCPSLYRHIFQSLYHTSLILRKREIDEIINFRNFRKLLINKFVLSFCCGILAPHFQTGKTKRSDRGHKACCNVWLSLVSS